MRQSGFLYFIQQCFQGFTRTVLISICLAVTVLLAVILLTERKEKTRDCSNEGLIYELNLIAPIQLDVNSWQIGDYASYRHWRKESSTSDGSLFDREVGFHVIGDLEDAGSHGYWLKKTGFPTSRTGSMDIYRWVTVHDLRITQKNRRYDFPRNHSPIRFTRCDQTSIPLAKLVKLGEEKIETEAGTFECIHYRAELRPNRNSLEIWASAAAPPLGIVRVRSQTTILELMSFGQETEIKVPKLIQPLIESFSIFHQDR